ncbi:hypothetical protein MWMV7_MWMV7_03283 [Acinetobacter calcoaceticus]|nr:hypothetical protein MWMV7_MWMV7_03283 [Acinetobacter calcoaceticus]
MNPVLKISDYVFIQFRTSIPTLKKVGEIYYPHLSKAKLLEKARKMEFPFVCYKLDESQKLPYLVDIIDLAFILKQRYQAIRVEAFMKGTLANYQG